GCDRRSTTRNGSCARRRGSRQGPLGRADRRFHYVWLVPDPTAERRLRRRKRL
ncbi:hypothetical protein LTR17_027546, partial [Elasticomyces elasticus]